MGARSLGQLLKEYSSLSRRRKESHRRFSGAPPFWRRWLLHRGRREPESLPVSTSVCRSVIWHSRSDRAEGLIPTQSATSYLFWKHNSRPVVDRVGWVMGKQWKSVKTWT